MSLEHTGLYMFLGCPGNPIYVHTGSARAARLQSQIKPQKTTWHVSEMTYIHASTSICAYIYMYIRVHKCIYAYTHVRMAYTPSAMTPAVHNHRANFSHAGSKLCQPVLVVQIYRCSLKASRKGTDVGPSPGMEHSRATLAQHKTPSPQNERHSRR